MPIINGKRRYILEEKQSRPAPGEYRRMIREAVEALPEQKRRYQKAEIQEEKASRIVKRYQKGGNDAAASVEAAVRQDIGNFVGGYEFSVKLSLGSVSFSKVTNLGGEIEIGTFVEGGNNDYPIVQRTPRRRIETIILEKGIPDSRASNLILSQLKEGTRVFSILIFVKKNGSTVKTFSITQGVILSRRYSALDANNSSLLIERLEIAHTGITEV